MIIYNLKKILYNSLPKYLVKEVKINLLWNDIKNRTHHKKEIILNIEDANLIFNDDYTWNNYNDVKKYIYNSYHITKIQKRLLKEWEKLESNKKENIPLKSKNSISDSKIIVKIEIEINEIEYIKLSYDEYKKLEIQIKENSNEVDTK